MSDLYLAQATEQFGVDRVWLADLVSKEGAAVVPLLVKLLQQGWSTDIVMAVATELGHVGLLVLTHLMDAKSTADKMKLGAAPAGRHALLLDYLKSKI